MSLPQLPDVPRHRRRTATAIAVGALAALCLAGLVLGLKGLFAPAQGEPASAGRDQAPSATSAQGGDRSPTTAPQDTSSPSTQAATDLQQFASPSGNIRCAVSSAGARCDIGQRDWQPTDRPASCTLDWGQGLFVDADQAGFVCAGDTVDRGSALGYGQSVTRGEFRCESKPEGVHCTHVTSGRGFTIARGSYQLS